MTLTHPLRCLTRPGATDARPAAGRRGPRRRVSGLALAAGLLAGVWASAWAAPAPAVDACPLIRPSDLSAAQVDQIVLDKVAIALQRPASQVATDQSLQAQAGQADAAALFGYTALAVGEALGFDAAARFQAAAQALGPDAVPTGLTVATLQAISRQAYEAGTDNPPPLADPQRVYALAGLQLRPPALAPGWYLLRCGHDQITFWRRGAADNEVATAVARISGLPAWSGMDAFVSYLREALMGSVPAGYRVRTLQVHALMGRTQPCVAASVLARAAGDAPFRLQARFCYAHTGARHGPTLLFSHAGSDDVAQFKREADAFLDGATAQP